MSKAEEKLKKLTEEFHTDIDKDQTDRHLSTSKWLLQNGLIDESIQENLVYYGYIASEDVVDFEVSLDSQNTTVYYRFYMSAENIEKYNKYKDLVRKNPKSIIGKYLKLRKLKKLVPGGGHRISVESNIRLFLRDLLPNFNVKINVFDIDEVSEENSEFKKRDNEEERKAAIPGDDPEAKRSDGDNGVD